MGVYNKCIQLACTIGVYIMAGYPGWIQLLHTVGVSNV